MSERRSEFRHRSYLAGSLRIDGLSTMDCLVRDLSVHGAKLLCSSAEALHDDVILDVKHLAMKRRARIVWRSAEGCGVQFADAAAA